MKKFTLNETDLRYMIHRAINEIISLEGEGEVQYPSDRYYFDSGWDRDKYKDNPKVQLFGYRTDYKEGDTHHDMLWEIMALFGGDECYVGADVPFDELKLYEE